MTLRRTVLSATLALALAPLPSLAQSPLAGPVRVADFGSGKGYLTFAVHDWLQARGLAPRGVCSVTPPAPR